MKKPKTLLDAVRYFSNFERCLNFMVPLRWPDGVTCPTCGSMRVHWLARVRRWQCSTKHQRRQFSLKTGTVFEDSPLGLDKWLPVLWLIVNCKNGISSYEVARAIGVCQKSAWFMGHRIRLALHSNSFEKMVGEIEVDETFIGGKARNMHAAKRREKIKGRGVVGKTAVMGLLERHGKDGHSTVRTHVVAGRRRKHLRPRITEHVEPGATIYTDELHSYDDLSDSYAHGVINHAETYVNGRIHTNGCENFWSLLKRSIRGTYVSVEPFHLFRYLDEQAYRFNGRHGTDSDRFTRALRRIAGQRLQYRELTGQPS